MDTIKENELPEAPQETEQELYTPRPMWQVWGARIALVIFIGFVILQLLQIAGGGR